MDLKIRRLVFCAALGGGVLGALIGAVTAGSMFNAFFAALLCATAAVAGVLRWSEHGGSRGRPARRARRPDQIPHQRRVGHVGGQDALRW
ncbi:hypothetical protein ACIP98_27345 [Streptomyces sp. NPDC088354]|uniref:hypothetical protein n=1 Tax=unclassified Streptomyces TaxID=2593676 RepID=UPI0029AA774B|nr:hypothetical protein [Streptomyces sp. MI02-7b]MDX3076877.1 hypothetical protein [Streptomyces sp. MI02-7b]